MASRTWRPGLIARGKIGEGPGLVGPGVHDERGCRHGGDTDHPDSLLSEREDLVADDALGERDGVATCRRVTLLIPYDACQVKIPVVWTESVVAPVLVVIKARGAHAAVVVVGVGDAVVVGNPRVRVGGAAELIDLGVLGRCC